MIKILHIYRGYGRDLKNTVVDNQITSLKKKASVEIFTYVIKKGGLEYLRSIKNLRVLVKKQQIDVIHTHYSFSGFVAGLAFTGKPIVCSLMGSDVLSSSLERRVLRAFEKLFWKITIVKSKEMQSLIPNSKLVPNGVDLKNFRMIEKNKAQNKVRFDHRKINILFVATSPEVPVKNLKLAKNAIQFLNSELKENRFVLNILSDIDYKELPYYYSAANMLIMTSLSEGSPNVIKEAMACNCPIIATDVGDIRELTNRVAECRIVKYEVKSVVEAIKDITSSGKRSNGRARLEKISSVKIVNELVSIYQSIIDNA